MLFYEFSLRQLMMKYYKFVTNDEYFKLYFIKNAEPWEDRRNKTIFFRR